MNNQFSIQWLDLNLNSKAPWKEGDRKWFSENPFRSFRLRRLFPNEFPNDFYEGQTHVLVRQLRPGFRDKQFCLDVANGASFDALPNTEEVCMALWIRLIKRTGNFALAEVVAEASLMGVTVERIQ